MSKAAKLKAEPRLRTGSGLLKQMRKEGWIPSIIYGGGQENRNVKVHAKTFTDLLAHSASENILIDLELEEGGNQLAFLQDVQHDPLTGSVLHADFLAIDDKTEISAQLPIELDGEPAGVKMGGLLEQMLHAVSIRCLPADLPETIEVDVAHMNIGDQLHIGEVPWPEGVKPSMGDDVVVALVAQTRVSKSEGGSAEEAEEAQAPA